MSPFRCAHASTVLVRRLLHALAGLTVAGALAGGAQAAVELSLSHYGTLQDSVQVAAERFKALVEAGSDGALTLSIHPDNQLGEPTGVLQGVRLGTIDIGIVPNPAFTDLAPALGVLDLPFLFDSAEHAYRALDGEVGRNLLDSLEEHNMKGLGLWEVGFADLANAVRPIRAPADVAGLRIGLPASPPHLMAFDLLEAQPRALDAAALREALWAGSVDGEENPALQIYLSGLYKLQDHLSLTRHAYTAAPLVMNLDRFNGLPQEARTLLVEAALAAAHEQRALNARRDGEALAALQGAGVAVVEDPDRDAFRQALAPVRAAFVASNGRTVLEQIEQLE
jgi:tripartite ATP-independent transporter DctP family solute receptor